MEVHLRSVHADVGDGSPWCNYVLAKPERSRYADRLDRSINASPPGQPHDRFRCFAVATVYSCCSAKTLRYHETIVVDIGHYDFRRRKELCRKQSREPDRSCTNNCNSGSWLNFTVEHAALKACRQDVAQHDQRFLIGIVRDPVQTRVSVGNAHILGLCPVDGVAENPSAVDTMRVHALSAILAFPACADARNENPFSWFECRDSWPNGFNETYAFVTEHATWSARGDIALEDVKVGTADSGLGNLNNRICWLRNCRLWPLFEGLFSWALKYQCLHKRCPCHSSAIDV